MSGVPQSDARKTNLFVDSTLFVKGKLVASNSEFENVTFRSGTIQLQNVETSTLETKELIVSGTSIPNGNVILAQNPNDLVAGQIAEFTTNGSTQVRSIPKTSVVGIALNYFFGNGSDGDVTISGGTTTLTRDMYYDTLTIDSTGILVPAGYCIFCKTACINNGLIQMNGGNGANAVGAVGGAGGTPATSNGGLLGGRPGGNGANATLSAPAVVGSQTLLGGAGGAGADTATTFGGNIKFGTTYVNGATFLGNIALMPFLFRVNSTGGVLLGGIPGGGGGGGAGGAVGGGGGGGAGGGWIMVVARDISGTGTFEAKGGNGGNGAAGGGSGGGGGGGVVYFLSMINSISALQILVTPGTAGVAVGGTVSARNGLLGVYQNNLLSS